MLFAYWLEGNKQFAPRVQTILESMMLRNDMLCTSLFAVAELLVHPVREGNASAQSAIEHFIRPPEVTLLDFLPNAPSVFAKLRAKHKLKPMDAFHLSIAITNGVDVFLTNDRRLHSVKENGFPLIASLETDIF